MFVVDGAEATRAAELRQTFIGVSLEMGPLTVRRAFQLTWVGPGVGEVRSTPDSHRLIRTLWLRGGQPAVLCSCGEASLNRPGSSDVSITTDVVR